jgi:hypothetical protein
MNNIKNHSWSRIPWMVVVILGVVLELGGCTNDEPTSPSEPFLLTRVHITRNLSPLPSVVLGAGQSVSFRYEVAYTLAPEDTAQKNNIALFSGFFGYDANDIDGNGNFIVDSAKFVTSRDFLPVTNSGIDSVTTTVSIPNNFVALNLITGIINPTTRFFIRGTDIMNWTVR